MAGYFAFPPPGFGPQPPFSSNPLPQDHQDTKAEPSPTNDDAAWEERQRQAAEVRRRVLEKERALARESELYWVSMGGSIRDAYGRKDHARTEELRAEVRIRKEEQKLLDPWDAYETRWRTLLASSSSIVFSDIPWPVHLPPSSIDELTPDAVAEFIFAPLRVRSNTASKKDRIRASILRWHPDKLSAVVARTADQDADPVREGINAVLRVLMALQDAERKLHAFKE